MSTLTIPAGERGLIHVFAVNRPAADVAQMLTARPMPDVARALLRAPHIDTASAEIFAMSDLAGVGLAAYLSQGYEVTDAALASDRAKLDALDGYVLLLFSDSFAGQPATLTPGPDVTLIGSYAEARADMTVRPIDAASARPYSGMAGLTPVAAPRGLAGSVLVGLALVVAVILLIWWILS